MVGPSYPVSLFTRNYLDLVNPDSCFANASNTDLVTAYQAIPCLLLTPTVLSPTEPATVPPYLISTTAIPGTRLIQPVPVCIFNKEQQLHVCVENSLQNSIVYIIHLFIKFKYHYYCFLRGIKVWIMSLRNQYFLANHFHYRWYNVV